MLVDAHYALGSTAADHGVPGVAEHAHFVAGKDSALRLRERLAGLASGETVLVVGGGLTGIEAATEIAETGRTWRSRSRPEAASATG